jgi:hypothetical protein
MAERGYAGLPRFLFMANALEAVLAGVGAAVIADAVTAVVSRTRIPRPGAVAIAGVFAAFAVAAASDIARLPAEARGIERVADMDAQLADAVDQAGGASAIFRCGRPATRWYTVTALAWKLGVGVTRVHVSPVRSRAVVFTPHHDRWVVQRRCRGRVSRATQPAPPR